MIAVEIKLPGRQRFKTWYFILSVDWF